MNDYQVYLQSLLEEALVYVVSALSGPVWPPRCTQVLFNTFVSYIRWCCVGNGLRVAYTVIQDGTYSQ